jgi:hypothetical protein
MANDGDIQPNARAEASNLASSGTEAIEAEIDAFQEGLAEHRNKLDSLYEDKYKNFFLQYPANVDNAVEERHWIRFDVRDIRGQQLKAPETQDSSDRIPQTSKSVKSKSFLGNAIESGAEKVSANIKKVVAVPGQIVTTTANEFLNDIPLFGGLAKDFLGLNKSQARGLGSILLYAPFQRADQSGFVWQTKAAGKLGSKAPELARGALRGISDIASAVRSGNFSQAVDTFNSGFEGGAQAAAIFGTLYGADALSAATGQFAPALRDQILREQGVAFNNHMESFFSDVSLRKFNFEFLLSPRTPDEAREIQQIIKMFKYAGHPAQYQGLHGVFFAYPQVFDIEFFNQDQTHKIGTSALTNMSTVYGGPTMNNTFYDKHPVQITLSLEFTELEILDKSRVDQGF